jgi:hypothetical protein
MNLLSKELNENGNKKEGSVHCAVACTYITRQRSSKYPASIHGENVVPK